MVQLRTNLKPADNTGVKKLRLILIHGGSKRKFGYVGDIVTASVIQTSPQSQIKKGEVVKAVIVRCKKETRRPDGSYIRFDDNAAVIIDNMKNKNPVGTRIFGPISREVKDAGFAKIASLAQEVV
jgi:large subunit ribosomal protein L14